MSLSVYTFFWGNSNALVTDTRNIIQDTFYFILLRKLFNIWIDYNNNILMNNNFNSYLIHLEIFDE